MSFKERGGYQPPEQPQRHEPEPGPYYRAARFREERRAAWVYQRVQDTIQGTPCDLSAYRFLLDQVAHVAVVGEPPAPALDQQLQWLLATGEPAKLPDGVVQLLTARRAQMRRYGPWIEGHYRPGQPL
jgi:hypothetical protein